MPDFDDLICHERKFRSLKSNTQHKHAAKAIRLVWEGSPPHLYQTYAEWMALPLIDLKSRQAISDRYHWHLEQAGLSLKEHRFLTLVNRGDSPSSTPFLPLGVYLDNLRSAYNVGNILRTVEAFRFGTVYFSEKTPYIDNPKVQKTSMHTFDQVPCQTVASLEELPRPLIALETVENAPSVFDYDFPETFTLMLGNEEYGLSEESLRAADASVQIPMTGMKNSINVAAAFAIAAGQIRQKAPL